MNTEHQISRAFGHRVQHRYDGLVAAGKHPSLRAIQSELNRLDALRLTEDEIAECLTPLDAGQRGNTSLSETASSSSRRAAHASAHAEEQGTEQAHFDAKMAHAAAAGAARSLSEYHDEQRAYHEKASVKPGTETPVESRASSPLCCARSLPSLLGDATVPTSILYMPQGLHRISPSQGGKPVSVVVGVNQDSAAQLERQRQILAAQGNKPFFSVQHNTQIAAFWPTRFVWDRRLDPTGKLVTGVWAEGEWSNAGREAVEGKNFRSFSPTFFVDKVSNDEDDPAQVECNEGAPLNMGALENDPAFGSAMSPLWHDQPRA